MASPWWSNSTRVTSKDIATQTSTLLDSSEWDHNATRSTRGWTPWCLRWWFLSFLAVASALIVVALQLLHAHSDQYGGFAFAEHPSGRGSSATFAYTYAPLIVSVLLGLCWACVDLQTKRYEPWLRLSLTDNVDAAKSILLTYPTDFAFFVPFHAARRKHWATLFASMATLVMAVVVTPAIGAIFKTAPLSTSMEVPVHYSSLPDWADQTEFITNPLGTRQIWSFALASHDGPTSVPAFATDQYALTPFYPNETAVSPWTATDFVMTANTTMWQINVQCQVGHEDKSSAMTLSDHLEIVTWNLENGCSTSAHRTNGTYDDQVWANLGMNCCHAYKEDDGCPPYKSWAVVAANASQYPENNAGPVHFCGLQLAVQDVTATVFVRNFSVQNVQPYGKATTLRGNDTLNMEVLSNVISRSSSDYFADLLVNGTTSVAASYEAALRVFYTSALTALWQPANASSPTITARVKVIGTTISMDSTFTILAQVGLAIVAGCSAALIFTMLCHHSLLQRDPSSLSRLAAFLNHNSRLRTLLSRLDGCNNDELASSLKYFSSSVEARPHNSQVMLEVQCEGFGATDAFHSGSIPSAVYREQKQSDAYIKPRQMSRSVGLLLQTVLLAAIVALLVLIGLGAGGEGMAISQMSSFSRNLLISFVPTAFATMMDSTFVLIARTAATIRPFEALHTSTPDAHHSVRLQYVAMVPQFMILTALRFRHYTLALLALTTIFAQLLAVGTSNLFRVESGNIHCTADFRSNANTTFSDYLDQRLNIEELALTRTSLQAYLGKRTELPPWSTEDYWFVPFQPAQSQPSSANTSRAFTRGFGLMPTCASAALVIPCVYAKSNIWDSFEAVKPINPGCGNFSSANFTLTMRDGSTRHCGIAQFSRLQFQSYTDDVRELSPAYNFYYPSEYRDFDQIMRKRQYPSVHDGEPEHHPFAQNEGSSATSSGAPSGGTSAMPQLTQTPSTLTLHVTSTIQEATMFVTLRNDTLTPSRATSTGIVRASTSTTISSPSSDSTGVFQPLGEQVIMNSAYANLTLGDTECPPYFVAGWVRNDLDGPTRSTPFQGPGTALWNTSGTFVACSADWRTAMFDVEIDTASGRVLSAIPISDVEVGASVARFFKGGQGEADSWLTFTMNDLDHPTAQTVQYNPQNLPTTYTNIFLGLALGNQDLTDPAKPVPKPEDVVPPLERILKLYTSFRFANNKSWWPLLTPPSTMPTLTHNNSLGARESNQIEVVAGSVRVTRQVLLFNSTALGLTLAILVFDLLVSIWIYWRPANSQRFLPRLPNSIASTLAYLAGGSVAEEIAEEEEKSRSGEKSTNRYAYGRFIGGDGKLHVGIERADVVVSLTRSETSFKHLHNGLREKRTGKNTGWLKGWWKLSE